ncbi:MAG: MBL fold metallo-hydrolase [Candidatus Methanoplasma sp.]|jgi:glyoxylase-like metal-dependent hydrolase (beta-lactamase superfamily II)|nr:MBL fold metallo-hydrolase [Candidatus Methanoplasma sp.]
MIKIDVLVIGDYERDAEGNVFGAYSTSTLIRTGTRNIVVDTSAKDWWPAVKTSFRQIGIFPEDVDTVILTHTHHDHIGNLDHYPKAKVLVHSGEEREVPGAEIIDSDTEIEKGIRLVHTPGHTPGSMSVYIQADKRYVLAGDAIPKKGNYEKLMPPAINTDPDAALKSIKEIIKYADVIIPGHDLPFVTR